MQSQDCQIKQRFRVAQAETEPCQTAPGCQLPLLTVLPDGLCLLLLEQLPKPKLIAEKSFPV